MEQIEQPEVEQVTEPLGGDGVSDILTEGLKDKSASPEESVQTDEGLKNNQPVQTLEASQAQEEVEELFGELLLEDEKKLPFKSKDELEAFIEKNKDIFDKTGHFLRQADYTRKTQELQREREEFEESRRELDESWGTVKPDENSMQAFKGLWSVFQHGSPDIQKQINSFMQDVSLLSDGKAPVGILSSGDGTPSQVQPEVIALRREIAELKQGISREKSTFEERELAKKREEAEREWTSWVQAQGENGIKVTEDLENAMIPYLQGVAHSDLSPKQKLDRAYRLAAEDLGLAPKEAVNKVFATAKEKSAKTPKAPTSKPVTAEETEASDVEGILRQGLKKLAS